MSTKKVTWYEKTVEYAFVRRFLEAAAMPLSGTAEKVGDTIFHEENSFYIIEFKRGLNLGEERKREIGKYLDIRKSVERILKHKACISHYVVLGYLDEKQEFGLKAQYYVDFMAEEYLNEYLNKYKECLNDDKKCFKEYSECSKKCLNENEKYLCQCKYSECLDKNLKKNNLDKVIKNSLSILQNNRSWQLTSTDTVFDNNPITDLESLKTYLQLLIDEKKSSSKDSSSVDYGNILIVDEDGNACALSDREGLQKLDLKFPTNTPSSTPLQHNKVSKSKVGK